MTLIPREKVEFFMAITSCFRQLKNSFQSRYTTTKAVDLCPKFLMKELGVLHENYQIKPLRLSNFYLLNN